VQLRVGPQGEALLCLGCLPPMVHIFTCPNGPQLAPQG
jgi:hypothetical protein